MAYKGYANKEKRKEYERQYMIKYRARKKVELEQLKQELAYLRQLETKK